MNIDRFRTLVDFLDGLPANAPFDIRSFFQGPKESLRRMVDFQISPLEAGVTCCAGGYACYIPTFQEQGLKIYAERYGELIVDIQPFFNDLYGLNAMQAFFEITQKQTFTIFGSFYWGSEKFELGPDFLDKLRPHHIVKRIRGVEVPV